MTNKPIRLADIARIARVHETTVSLALRGCPNISVTTRQKIKLLADKLGYQPNPAFQALTNYSKGAVVDKPKVLFITDHASNEIERCGFSQQPYYRGALKCVTNAGFRLERVVVSSEARPEVRIDDRGFAGVLVGKVNNPTPLLRCVDRDKVLLIKIGGAVAGVKTSLVLEDTASMMRTAMHHAKKRGAKRIGFILPQSYDEFVGGDWQMAYLRSQIGTDENPLPILHLCNHSSPARDLGLMEAWINRWRPDCIIGFTEHTKAQIGRLGLRIPEDVGYIQLFVPAGCSDSTGLRDHREVVGEVAADLLIRAIRGHRSPPLFATTTLVESRWEDGTLPFPHKADEPVEVAIGENATELIQLDYPAFDAG